jgi:ATP-dependent protease ClpP protease subunit
MSRRYHPYKKQNSIPEEDKEPKVDKSLFSSKLNPFKSLFSQNQDTDVYLEDNHLYFKTDVDSDSINKLCSLIRKYVQHIRELEVDTKIAQVNPKPLYLHITTYGGDLYQSFLAYDYIKSSPVPIYTIIEGYSASAGTVMSLGGVTRYITPSSVMLIHQLSTWTGGKYEEIADDFENSKEDMERLKDLYYKECKGKMTKREITEELKHDRWWKADKCVKKGLCDEIQTIF